MIRVWTIQPADSAFAFAVRLHTRDHAKVPPWLVRNTVPGLERTSDDA